ncbi:MAG: tRNA (adenosine(37)-N6)-dimethylallyltransferase MiaA [Nitrospirae bacterium]|nr:tRNA (adenosine(37)-N6)-dimethylallyltransferase MiaA [Nitrospirota bacterium]
MPDNTVIILCGPTAVGKTALSVALARRINAEIICADSMVVYRGMDIGTAKPSPDEQADVPHHLIDVADPSETFSAAKFLALATAAIDDIAARGRLPLVAGGTGLYVMALTHGLLDAPSSDPEILCALEREARASGPEVLHRRLAAVDHESARRIHCKDAKRIVRALAVWMEHGVTISRLQAMQPKPPPYDFIRICLTRDRAELCARINRRVDEMIADGLVDETRRVIAGGASRSAMQGLGYKEIGEYLAGRATLDEAAEMIRARTRLFAKRQMTWFRRDTSMRFVDITGLVRAEEMLAAVLDNVAV